MLTDYEIRMRVIAEAETKALDDVHKSLSNLGNVQALGLNDLYARMDSLKVKAADLGAQYGALDKVHGSLFEIGKTRGVLDDLGGTVNGLASRLGHLAGIPVIAGFGAAGVAAAGFAAALKHGVDLAMEAEVQMAGAAGYGDTLAGTWDWAGLQVDKLSLSLGTALMPALESSAVALNELLNSREVEDGVATLARGIRTDLVPAIQGIPQMARDASAALAEMGEGIRRAYDFLFEHMPVTSTILFGDFVPKKGSGDAATKESYQFGLSPISQDTLNGLIALDAQEFGDVVRAGAIEVANAMSNAAVTLSNWDRYVIAAGNKAPMGTAEMMRRKGKSVGDLGDWQLDYEYVGSKSLGMRAAANAPDAFADILNAKLETQAQLLSRIAQGTEWVNTHPGDALARGILNDMKEQLSGIKTGIDGIGMPDMNTSLANAFPNAGAAMEWQGAFEKAQGRKPGPRDVRDMMAGRQFAGQNGLSEIPLSAWTERYYKNAFPGEDSAGLDAIFGKPGTWKTLVDEKGKQEAEEYKKLVAAFDRGTAATAANGSKLDALIEKITPAGSGTPPPGGSSGRDYSESKYG